MYKIMILEQKEEQVHSVYSINERLESLILKSKNADKYEMLKNGLDMVKSMGIGAGVATAAFALYAGATIPFAEEVRQLQLANILGDNIKDAFVIIAGTAAAYYGSKTVNNKVVNESKAIDQEYKSIKNDSLSLKADENNKQRLVDYVQEKVEKADIISPVVKRDTTIGELSERSKKRNSMRP